MFLNDLALTAAITGARFDCLNRGHRRHSVHLIRPISGFNTITTSIQYVANINSIGLGIV